MVKIKGKKNYEFTGEASPLNSETDETLWLKKVTGNKNDNFCRCFNFIIKFIYKKLP